MPVQPAASTSSSHTEYQVDDKQLEQGHHHRTNTHALSSSSLSSIVLSIAYGQIMSLILSGTNIFNALLNEANVYPALFPNELVYHCILLISLSRLAQLIPFYRHHLSTNPSLFIYYLVMGITDFAANVTVLKSFETTSSLSVMVITSTSVIFAMFMSMLVFKRHYGFLHLLGTLVVMAGLFLIHYSKYMQGIEGDQDLKWLGTALAFIAAMLYALSNVIQEYTTRYEESQYPMGTLGAMGCTGSLISLIVTQGTEWGQQDRDALLSIPTYHGYFVIGYILCMVAFYMGVPLYLQKYSAVRFNFSILTADIFVYIFNRFYKQSHMDGFYLAGFVCVLMGLFVFNLREPVDRKTIISSRNVEEDDSL